jgi:hypothetical protein
MKSLRPVLWALLVPVLFSIGCGGSNNKGKIEGTKWSSEKGTVEGKEVGEGDLYLEFTKDGKLYFVTTTVTLKGTCSVGSGDQVTFEFDKEVSGNKTHVEQISISGERLTLSGSKGTIVFSQLHDDKYENTTWVSEAGKWGGQPADLHAGAIRFDFHKDRSVFADGNKVGTFEQGKGTLTINFSVRFKDMDWKSKDMPVADHRRFSMTDSAGNAVKFKRLFDRAE